MTQAQPTAHLIHMLPGFDAIPDDTQKRSAEKRLDSGVRYYLRIQTLKGDWLYYWGNDPLAGAMWVKESEINKYKPRLYRTTSRAMRMLERLTSKMVLEGKRIAVWERHP